MLKKALVALLVLFSIGIPTRAETFTASGGYCHDSRTNADGTHSLYCWAIPTNNGDRLNFNIVYDSTGTIQPGSSIWFTDPNSADTAAFTAAAGTLIGNHLSSNFSGTKSGSLNATWTVKSVYVSSGRAHYYRHVYTVQANGTVQ